MKKRIGYGTGITMLGTMEESDLDIEYFVDDNPKLNGERIVNKTIHSSSTLRRLKDEKIGSTYLG